MSGRRQPQRLPPPLAHGGTAIEAEVVLREVPESLGLVLWKTVRSVRLWAEIGEGERPRAFGRDASGLREELLREARIPEEVRQPLGKLAAVLQPRARAGTVATVSRAVAEWAEKEGKLGTALEFLQAAAFAMPLDAELAYEAGRVARERLEYARAETWFRHAVSRARKTQNRYEFARAYIGLGNIFLARSNHPQARRSLIRGLRAARRFSIRPLVAAAYHEMAVLAIRGGRAAEVGRYVRAAIDAYGAGHPRLADLAVEVGNHLVDSGHIDEARRLFAQVPCDSVTATERLSCLAGAARLALAKGDSPMYTTIWDRAEDLLTDDARRPVQVAALLSLAEVAALAGQVERSERVARAALARARVAGDSAQEEHASEFLSSLASGERRAGVEAREAPPQVVGLVDEFAAALK